MATRWVLLAAAPVIFGSVRAINTGDDFRYLWLGTGTSAVLLTLARGGSA